MAVDVVLVNPSNKRTMFGKLSDLSASEPPLWIGLCAGYVRGKGYSVKVIDADAMNWGPQDTVREIENLKPLVIGIGAVGANPSASSTPKMPAARDLLNLLDQRLPDIKTVLFGIHPGALPELTLKEEKVDFVVRGEVMRPLAELLGQIKAGTLSDNPKIKGLWYHRGTEIVDNGWADQEPDLDKLPFVAWDLLPMDQYRAHTWHCYGHINQRSPYAIIFTSLGCIFNCTYCNIHDLYGEKPGMRFRSPKNVIEEIDLLVKNYHIHNFKFLDELFVLGVNEKHNHRMHEICDMLIERNYNLNIWAYARIDTVNEEILKKLKRAGVNWICYGIEGGNKAIRDKVSKGQFDDNRIDRAVKMTYDAGIYIIGNFMFGLPNDDLNSMQETLDLAKRIKCEYANFYVTMAYPGSKLYEEAVAQGLRLPLSWAGYSQYSPDIVPMPTKYLAPEKVLKFRDEAFNEYFNEPSYQAMIRKKFGQETFDHIKEMLSISIDRNILKAQKAGSAV